ncbi:MAG: GNAT family N-acetyltransferase [Verrucomicrobiales bacterium]|nr:GNAT family N-acetyltransferase [Verrucomicrobiales bacterium]
MIQVLRASWNLHREQLLAVRREVFINEQNVPEEIEIDELDPIAHHLLALLSGKEPVGTARWIIGENKCIRIGRVAVLKSNRRDGIGSLLIQEALSDAKKSGFLRAHLHAQVSSIPFYSHLGFKLTDIPEFEEAGIPHREMEIQLA